MLGTLTRDALMAPPDLTLESLGRMLEGSGLSLGSAYCLDGRWSALATTRDASRVAVGEGSTLAHALWSALVALTEGGV